MTYHKKNVIQLSVLFFSLIFIFSSCGNKPQLDANLNESKNLDSNLNQSGEISTTTNKDLAYWMGILDQSDLDVSSWNVFNGSKLEISYPKGWRVNDSNQTRLSFSTDFADESTNYFLLNVFENGTISSLKDYYNSKNNQTIMAGLGIPFEKGEILKFGEISAVLFHDVPGFMASTVVLIAIGNQVYEFKDYGQQFQQNGLFNLWLSTFKVK